VADDASQRRYSERWTFLRSSLREFRNQEGNNYEGNERDAQIDKEPRMPLKEAAQERLKLVVWRRRPLSIVVRWPPHVVSASDAHMVLT